MNKSNLRMCLIGPKESYPAFDSVFSILGEVLGKEQVIALRIGSWRKAPPLLIKPLLFIFQDLFLYLSILRCYKRNKINSVFFFQNYCPFSALALKPLKAKLFLFIGGSLFYWSYLENNSTMGRIVAYSNLPIQNSCYRLADILITLSPRMVEECGIGKFQQKTRFALPRFNKNFSERFSITEDYKRRNNVIGFVGLLCKRKGISNLLRAIQFIKTDCSFSIVGGGPLLSTTKSERKKLNKSTRIVGIVSDSKLRDSFNEMKLYVLPAYAEGIPSTIFEAMACGTPVLVTSVGGIPDVVKEGETGFLLRSNNPKHIAERIEQLLNSPKLLEKVSAKGYEYVREVNSEEKVLKAWRIVFQK